MERARSLKDSRWTTTFKIAMVVIMGVIVFAHLAAIPLQLIAGHEIAEKVVSGLEICLTAAFLIALLIAAIYALVMGAELWLTNELDAEIRFRHYNYMADLVFQVVLICVVIARLSLFGSSVQSMCTIPSPLPPSPEFFRYGIHSNYALVFSLAFYAIFSVTSMVYFAIGLIFLQTNLYKDRMIFKGFRQSFSSSKKSSEEKSAPKSSSKAEEGKSSYHVQFASKLPGYYETAATYHTDASVASTNPRSHSEEVFYSARTESATQDDMS